MRSIWKGQVGFGLISVPCKLYGACDDKKISFHQIHAECGSRISMPRWCPKCERKVEGTEIKKGYEVGDGLVLLDEGDFASLPLKTLKQVEVVCFTKDSPDPRAYDEAYYLAPDKGGDKPFALLHQTMKKLGVKAIGKLAYRDREHICVVSPFDGVMLLQTLHWADEIRPADEIKPSMVALSEKELQLGETLIGQMIGVFAHASFHDDYRQALEALVTAKVEGKALASPAETPVASGDLVSQLLASLGIKEMETANVT